LRVAAALAAAVLLAGCGGREGRVAAETFDGGVTFRNLDGEWTVYTRCADGAGPGYVARLVRSDGVVVTDDRGRAGGSNKPGNGGLGEFGWHGARSHGRAFDYDYAWTIDGRTCGNVGVASASVVDEPRVDGDIGRMTIDVFLRDNHVLRRRPMLRVRYRYRIHPHVVRVAIGVTELCHRGRCGWQGRAFVKEPKLQASVTGGRYSRLVVLDGGGRVARNVIEDRGSRCVWAGVDARRQTGQCDDPRRAVVRFEGQDVRALNVRMTAVGAPWQSGRGLDGWALASARRTSYALHDSALDGVRWSCKTRSPANPIVRRWELGGGAKRGGAYVAASAMFPGWEGGRGYGDCEPLARAFGPRGESWNLLASYWFDSRPGVRTA